MNILGILSRLYSIRSALIIVEHQNNIQMVNCLRDIQTQFIVGTAIFSVKSVNIHIHLQGHKY